ncbi:MAG TPA: hypothetical protein VEI97_08960 [bacterium]|nr:hypothetical protein [bacterium]
MVGVVVSYVFRHLTDHRLPGLPLFLVRNLLYPLLALAGSALGSLVLWLRSRKPRSFEASIDDFHRGLKALEPEGQHQESAPNWKGRSGMGRAP